MSTPNYKSWTPKILKEIINRCNNQAMIYFDINTRNNLQNKYFASIELGSQLKKQRRNNELEYAKWRTIKR